MRIAARMIVRNAADTLPFVIRHHAMLGIDAFYVADNDSTDATPCLLDHLSRSGFDLVWYREGRSFVSFGEWQQEVGMGLQSQASAAGADWVVPIDADEFWHVPGGFRRVLGGRDGVLAMRFDVLNFVQWRRAKSLATVIARPRAPIRKGVYDRAEAAGSAPPWILRRFPQKLIVRSDVALGPGAHWAVDPETPIGRSDEAVCLHAPIRSPSAAAGKPRYRRVREGTEIDRIWKDNTWVLPWRLGSGADAAPLTVDLRIARIALRHALAARRDRLAALRVRT